MALSISVALLATLLNLAGSASAAPAANPQILSVNRGFSASYLSSSLYYVEPSGSDAFVTGTDYLDYEEGKLGGVELAASWMFPEFHNLYAHLEWSGVDGDVEYTGFTQGSPPIPIYGATSHATIQDYAFKLGKGIATGERWMATPYWALGGRHWVRTLAPDEPFVFVESYNHLYTSLGGLVQYSPSDRWVLGFDGSVGRTFNATINVPSAGLNHQRLGSSPIVKLGVEADAKVSGRLHFFTGFDYTYFTYGQSGVVVNETTQVIEPHSRTETYNFNFGLRLAY